MTMSKVFIVSKQSAHKLPGGDNIVLEKLLCLKINCVVPKQSGITGFSAEQFA